MARQRLGSPYSLARNPRSASWGFVGFRPGLVLPLPNQRGDKETRRPKASQCSRRGSGPYVASLLATFLMARLNSLLGLSFSRLSEILGHACAALNDLL
jgi:hypothetical protein